MYANLHTLPLGKAMFTLHLGQRGTAPELTEERDVVGPADPPEHRYLAGLILDEHHEMLAREYGPETEVRGIVNQSRGYTLFDSRVKGFRPLPAVLPPATIIFDRPYDTLIDLFLESHDDMGSDEYLNHLLGA